MRLGSMKHPDGSRVAATALNDPSAIIRATAASAVLSLPSEESVVLLIPLLNDKKEFVRQQAAYALGETHSPAAVEGLVTALERDKLPSVRGAAAVALGMIGDEKASSHLARTIDPAFVVSARFNQKGKRKDEKDRFVQRAAIHSLGQMRSRASVPALIAVMTNEKMNDDVRREAALSLGLIGDVAAVPVLRTALESHDPYLARIAFDALLKISRLNSNVAN
jgi:HEAT repeat protein